MANSRIMLVCKHCGENFCIGKGYYGSYSTCNDELHKQLNIFYNEHEHGCCSDDTDCSDNARNHFAILEEGETLAVLDADVVPKREVEMLQGALKAGERHNELTMEMAQKALANAKTEVEELKAIIADHKANEERWQELYADTVDKWEEAYEKLEIQLDNAKAEVEKIFEEIEKAYERSFWIDNDNIGHFQRFKLDQYLAELKKKYTEDKK